MSEGLAIRGRFEDVHTSDGAGSCEHCGTVVDTIYPAGCRVAMHGRDPLASWKSTRWPTCHGAPVRPTAHRTLRWWVPKQALAQ